MRSRFSVAGLPPPKLTTGWFSFGFASFGQVLDLASVYSFGLKRHVTVIVSLPSLGREASFQDVVHATRERVEIGCRRSCCRCGGRRGLFSGEVATGLRVVD